MNNATPGPLKLTEIDRLEALGGLDDSDFGVFEIEGLAPRMTAIRAQLKPKLTALGEILAPELAAIVGGDLHAHVAQHLRRTVHPPVETWVAFARSRRAYKPFVHYRIAVSADRLRIVMFLEDDAEDKPVFAETLQKQARALSKYFHLHPEIASFHMVNDAGEPLHGSQLTPSVLQNFGARLAAIKLQHASFGITYAATHPAVAGGLPLARAVIEAAHTLLPLYQCGAGAPLAI